MPAKTSDRYISLNSNISRCLGILSIQTDVKEVYTLHSSLYNRLHRSLKDILECLSSAPFSTWCFFFFSSLPAFRSSSHFPTEIVGKNMISFKRGFFSFSYMTLFWLEFCTSSISLFWWRIKGTINTTWLMQVTQFSALTKRKYRRHANEFRPVCTRHC